MNTISSMAEKKKHVNRKIFIFPCIVSKKHIKQIKTTIK